MRTPLPPKDEPLRQRSATLFERQWRRCSEIARARHVSDAEVLRHLLDYALGEVDRMRAGEPSEETLWVLEQIRERGQAKLAEEIRRALASKLKSEIGD